MGHAGVGLGESCKRGGVGHPGVGWDGPCMGGLGHAGVELGHAGVGWGGHVGVGWVM